MEQKHSNFATLLVLVSLSNHDFQKDQSITAFDKLRLTDTPLVWNKNTQTLQPAYLGEPIEP